jgi:serine phosphatase RsbU (regulator of sigma subunit)
VYKHLSQLIISSYDLSTNRLVENLTDAEVRRSTAQFLGILTLLGLVVILIDMMTTQHFGPAGGLLTIAWAGFYVVAIGTVYFTNLDKYWCVRLSLLIIICEGIIAIVRWVINEDPSPGSGTVIGVLIGLTLGALWLPWSPRETLSLSLLWIVSAILSLFLVGGNSDFSVPAAVFVYIAVTIPGTMISFFRMSRFQDQFELHFIQSQFEEVREELQAAKNIHERGFPKPKSSGALRFTYVYRPMRQIGGDSIFASIQNPGEPQSPLTLVLYDVSGHGLSAALTANRLQGELMRIMGEDPCIDPGELLTKLDRYVCLTLTDAAVLVTAVAINANPELQTIRIANAGHPAAIFRSPRATTKNFESTAPLMGLGMDSLFEPIVEEYPFKPGDSLVAYTDGVSEASVNRGEMYSTEGVTRVLEQDWSDQSERWPEKILTDVENRRAGPASDDILIVELYHA